MSDVGGTVTIVTDAQRLAAWTLNNLDEYGRPLLARATAFDMWRLGSLPIDGAARPLYATPFARRRDALAFADMVITDAHRRSGALHAAGRVRGSR